VGSRVARLCARAGARLVVSDLDRSRRGLAEELGARWVGPERALESAVDILVPCALGGILNKETAPRLRCRIIAGAANNQLADDGIADLLAAQEILWAPDFVVNAGGVIYGSAMEFEGCTREDAIARVGAVSSSLEAVFSAARQHAITPLAAARRVADERLEAARSRRAGVA
jgi:leucine dehydrogenase